MPKIPTVDLLDDNPEATRVFGQALEEIGFVFLRLPNSQKIMASHYGKFRKLFSLPARVKERYAHEEIFYQRGWTPNNKEVGLACRRMGPEKEDRPDAKECWGMGPGGIPDGKLGRLFSDFYPQNIWPEEVTDLRTEMETLYSRLHSIGMTALGFL